MLKQIILSILFVSLTFPVYSGPWNKAKKKGYTQFGFTYLTYDRLLMSGERAIDLKRSISDHTLQLYTEYGLSDRFNLIVNIPFKMVGSGDNIRQADNDPYVKDTLESGFLSGISNIDIGLRYVILQKKYILSAQLMFGANISQYEESTGLRIGYDAYSITPLILVGRGWQKNYIQFGSGATFKTSGYAQNYVGMFEVGHKIFKEKSLIILRFDVRIPMTTGTFDEGNSVQTALFRDNSAFISPGFKFIHGLTDHLYLNMAIYGSVYARHEGASVTLNAGLAYDW